MSNLFAPRVLHRLQALPILALVVLLYIEHGGSWWLFAVLFLAPDLAALGYLAGYRLGNSAYNLAHSWAGPVIMGLIGLSADWPLGMSLGLIWAAHIAFDHAVGYDLKPLDLRPKQPTATSRQP